MNATDKILSFLELPIGWNYGQGRPPTREQALRALYAVATIDAAGFPIADAFPGNEGEIMVTGYRGELYLELTFEENEDCAFVIEDGDEELLSLEGLPDSDALAYVSEIGSLSEPEAWRSFALLIHDSMTRTKKDLSASQSDAAKTPQETGVFHALNAPAQKQRADAVVLISTNTMPTLRNSLPSTGNLANQIYQQAAA